MRLILIGCEYSGTTTLAHAINEWTKETMDKEFTLIHDHFKLPDTKPHGPELTDEEIAQFDALSPRLTEVIMRHNLYYHTPAESAGPERTFSESASTSKRGYTDRCITVTGHRANWVTDKQFHRALRSVF